MMFQIVMTFGLFGALSLGPSSGGEALSLLLGLVATWCRDLVKFGLALGGIVYLGFVYLGIGIYGDDAINAAGPSLLCIGPMTCLITAICFGVAFWFVRFHDRAIEEKNPRAHLFSVIGWSAIFVQAAAVFYYLSNQFTVNEFESLVFFVAGFAAPSCLYYIIKALRTKSPQPTLSYCSGSKSSVNGRGAE